MSAPELLQLLAALEHSWDATRAYIGDSVGSDASASYFNGNNPKSVIQAMRLMLEGKEVPPEIDPRKPVNRKYNHFLGFGRMLFMSAFKFRDAFFNEEPVVSRPARFMVCGEDPSLWSHGWSMRSYRIKYMSETDFQRIVECARKSYKDGTPVHIPRDVCELIHRHCFGALPQEIQDHSTDDALFVGIDPSFKPKGRKRPHMDE